MANHHCPNKTAALKQHGEEHGEQPVHLIDQEPLIAEDSDFTLFEVHPCGVLMDLCWHCMVGGRVCTVTHSVKICILTKVDRKCLH